MNTADQDAAELAADFERSKTNCRNLGYRDGYTGETANPPAWGTVPEWIFAYSEGYHLGRLARAKIKPKHQRPLF